MTIQNGQTYIWTDGLVEFNNTKGQIVIKPAGQISISVDASISHKDNHFSQFGWIVEKLNNYNLRSSPDLSKIDKGLYSLDSFLIGNFYFPDHKSNAYTELQMYLNKVTEIKNKVYSLL